LIARLKLLAFGFILLKQAAPAQQDQSGFDS
jgi:hypothetical protein